MIAAGFESHLPGDRPEQGQIPTIGTPIELEKIEDIERKLGLSVLATIERADKSNSVQFTEAIAAVWQKHYFCCVCGRCGSLRSKSSTY